MTDQSNDAQQRLIDLESLLAHQQRLIDHLDETLRNHEARLAAVERRLTENADQIDRLFAHTDQTTPNEKPPHY